MVPEFGNVAFYSLPVGQTSDLVNPFGYHIIHVNSRTEETDPPLAQVKERISGTILAQRTHGMLATAQATRCRRRSPAGRGLEEAARARAHGAEERTVRARRGRSAPRARRALIARAFDLQGG